MTKCGCVLLGNLLIVRDKLMFAVGDGVGERDRDKGMANHEHDDLSHPSGT